MTEFVIKSGVPIPDTRGRKPGSKDSRKFANRGRPPKRGAVQSAADEVRAGRSIQEAANDSFSAYCGQTISYSDEARQKRFVRFLNEIAENLRQNPRGKGFHVYRELGKLHMKYMRSPRYKENRRKDLNVRIQDEYKKLSVVNLQNALKSIESNE